MHDCSARQWTLDDMVDMTGKTIIVTGGNSGIGYFSCLKLVEKNAYVYLAARNSQKSKDAVEKIKKDTGKTNIELLPLDLADLQSVRKAAETFLSKENQLHVLLNNAGVMTTPVEQLTKDGYDLQFGINVLGHFHFTMLLLPCLLNTPNPRVINLTSSAHELSFAPDGLYWNHLKGPKTGSKNRLLGFLERWRYYNQSKLGIVLFTNELVRRYGDRGLIAIPVHPGRVNTELTRNLSPGYQSFWRGTGLLEIHQGAITQLFAATAPEAAELSGRYLVPLAKVGTPSKRSQNRALAIRMWDYCENELKAF